MAYQTMREAGKAAKTAIIAVARRLLVRINGHGQNRPQQSSLKTVAQVTSVTQNALIQSVDRRAYKLHCSSYHFKTCEYIEKDSLAVIQPLRALREKISIVTVTHESSGVVERLLMSVKSLCPVIIVDNASTDLETTEKIVDRYSASLITNSVNRGFGFASNLGLANTSSEFVLFANPDIELLDGALEGLVAGLEKYPDCVAANPNIVDNSRRSRFKGRSVLIDSTENMREPAEASEVLVLSGAALCVRRDAFLKISGFDEHIFLFHEDDDLSIRLRGAGGVLMYLPAASVIHTQGTGSIKSPSIAWRKGWAMGRSRVYTVRKHRVSYGVSRAVLSAFGHMVKPQMLWSPVRWAKQSAFLFGVLCETLTSKQPSPQDEPGRTPP